MGKLLHVKALIFDLDGTVVDSKEAYYEAARVAMRTLQKDPIGARAAIEIPRRLEQDKPIDELIGDTKPVVFAEIYLKAYYKATAERSSPLPKIAFTLERLSSRFSLALTTRRNVSEKEVRRELAKFGLKKYFSRVITSEETTEPKPSPEALLKCAEYMKVSICDCVVVGDSVADMRAGKNAGARTVAVLTGIFTRKELEKTHPDLILNSVSELPEFLP